MNPNNGSRLALGALILLSLIWGYNWVVMKQVMQYVDPFDFSALRTLLGAAALFGVLLARRGSLRPVAVVPTIWLGLVQTAGFTAVIQWALVNGGAGKTVVLVYAMPFWLLPMAWWLFGERVGRVQWIAVVLALIGLVFILEPWHAAGGSLFSDMLALSGSVLWAASSIMAKRMRQRFQVDLLSLTAWQMLFGALALSAVAWVLPSRPIEPTACFFGALVFCAVAATGLAWLLWLFILDRLPAGLAGLSSLAVPAIGVLSAWLELGEQPSGSESVGMLFIGGALVVVSLLTLGTRTAAAPKAEAAVEEGEARCQAQR